jgi:hypothetical protein
LYDNIQQYVDISIIQATPQALPTPDSPESDLSKSVQNPIKSAIQSRFVNLNA